MPASQELPQHISPPPGKSLDVKAPGWRQIFGANPWGCVGGMVMDEIDTCITISAFESPKMAFSPTLHFLLGYQRK